MPSTAIAYSDMAPSPRVVIDVDEADLNPACVSAQVLQVSAWGSFPVENRRRPVSGGLVVYDYTVPAGVNVVYRVRQFDATGGDLGLTLSLPAQVEIPENMAVVSDPLAPSTAVMLRMHMSFAPELARSRNQRVYQAGGMSFAMSGLRSAFQSVQMRLWSEAASDMQIMEAALEQPMILVRTHPTTRLPGSFYASVVRDSIITWGAQLYGIPELEDRDAWALSADEVSRPTVDVLVPVYSYDLFKAYLDAKYPPEATYDDAAAEWSTYIEALRNPPPVV